MDTETGNAARCRRYKERRQAKGFTRIWVDVPAGREDEVRAFAASLAKRSEPEPDAEPAAKPQTAAAWDAALGADWTRR